MNGSFIKNSNNERFLGIPNMSYVGPSEEYALTSYVAALLKLFINLFGVGSPLPPQPCNCGQTFIFL